MSLFICSDMENVSLSNRRCLSWLSATNKTSISVRIRHSTRGIEIDSAFSPHMTGEDFSQKVQPERFSTMYSVGIALLVRISYNVDTRISLHHPRASRVSHSMNVRFHFRKL